MTVLYPALILRILSNPAANALQKHLGNNDSSFTVNFYSTLFMALFCLPLAFKINFLSLGFDFYSLVLFAGFLCFMGTICLIKALSIGEMSVLGPINSYKSVVGLIIAFFLLSEVPSIQDIFGFLIIFLSSFLFADNNGHFFFNKSVLLRFLALFFTGFEAVILKKIILMSSPFVCLFFWAVSGLIFSFIFALFFNKIKPSSFNSVKSCFLIAILLLIMQLSTNYVFNHLEVGLSLALFQLSSLVSLFIGFKIFKEKNAIKKSIGTVLMLFGSILILM